MSTLQETLELSSNWYIHGPASKLCYLHKQLARKQSPAFLNELPVFLSFSLQQLCPSSLSMLFYTPMVSHCLSFSHKSPKTKTSQLHKKLRVRWQILKIPWHCLSSQQARPNTSVLFPSSISASKNLSFLCPIANFHEICRNFAPLRALLYS